MTIVRRRRIDDYTVIPNSIFDIEKDNEGMSFLARALLVYILTKPDEWSVNTKHLQKITGYGRDKVQNLVREWIDYGYAKRVSTKGEKGCFSGQELVVYDFISGEPENTVYGDGEPDNGEPENPSDGKSGPIVNTNNITITESNISSDKSDMFEVFWKTFNDKRGKEAALKIWKRKKLNSKANAVIAGAREYVSARGSEQQFWKMAQGWLNDGRWEDYKITDETDLVTRLEYLEVVGKWKDEWGPRPDVEITLEAAQ